MTSKRPYLLRAINEWILDNGNTPHLLVDANAEGVEVPMQYVQDGKIVLNISPNAVRELEISNELVLFNARFGGRVFYIRIPVRNVLAVYAKENGMGIIFPDEENETDSETGAEANPETNPETKNTALEKAPHLKLVK